MSDRTCIEEWLARNGGARRFEMGASGEPTGLTSYLQDKGYTTAFTGWKGGRRCKVTEPVRRGADGRKLPGKVHHLTMVQLIAFVDRLRQADGLQPLMMENVDG